MGRSGNSHYRRCGKGVLEGEAIVGACPAPCLMISQERIIQHLNQAFAHWLRARHDDLLGQPIDRYFQIHGHFRLEELWTRFGEGYTKAIPAKLAYVAPGRVTVAKAYLCAISVNGPKDFSCLVMLDQTPSQQGAVAGGAAGAVLATPLLPVSP